MGQNESDEIEKILIGKKVPRRNLKLIKVLIFINLN